MCPNRELYNLKVTNRGTACTTTITNQAWSVNLPEKLTTGSRPCSVTVKSATIQILTDPAIFHTYSEVGIRTNIPLNGFSTESSSANGYQTLQQLFSVDLTTDFGDNVLSPFKMDQSRTFYCPALPNQLEFGRFYTTTGSSIPFAGDWYVAFELEIDFSVK